MRVSLRPVAFVAVLQLLLSLTAAAHAQTRAESEARVLEERLHAPCCRDNMLEAHDSEPARALRTELRARFAAGESEADVERALIARYGASIVAVPAERDPRGALSWALFTVLAGSAVALFVAAQRWRRNRSASELTAPPEQASSPEAAAARERADAELERLLADA